jgi:5-methylcytosine-specific restriction enzyme A
MAEPKNTMSFSAFCARVAGAPMRNPRNSWCAHSPQRRRAVFTVWADLLVNGRYVFWPSLAAPYMRRPGATEMRRVIEAVMREGYESLGILCYAEDTDADPRVRQRFIEVAVLILKFADEPDGLVAYVQGEVSTDTALRGPVAAVSQVPSAINDIDDPPPGTVEPESVSRQVQGYRRDEAVRRHVFARAKGQCEHCGKTEFLTVGGTPYLEAHHIINLAKQGPDTVRNVVALCSSHHREAHYGEAAVRLEQEFIEMLARIEPERP